MLTQSMIGKRYPVHCFWGMRNHNKPRWGDGQMSCELLPHRSSDLTQKKPGVEHQPPHLTMTTTPSSVPAQHSPVCASTARAVMVASATASFSAATAALCTWYIATQPLT